jgi:tRNA nucleotidyltransferase (CCA-adding enzyme)
MRQGLKLESEEATIALTAVYADTGRLIYENVCRDDFEASAWLLDMGASLKLVKTFLETIKEDSQVVILNQLLLAKNRRAIQGHVILSTYLELDANVAGLAAVVEKIMEIENPDAYFALFYVPKRKTTLLIARSQKAKIDLHELLQNYGGGGHQAAASAKITGRDGLEFRDEFFACLENSLVPATRAGDIMTKNVYTIYESTALKDASMFLERVDLTGVPVVSNAGDLIGFLSLRDIMKGRKASAMNAPVTAYMSKPLVSAESGVTMREIERIFYKYHIGHLPIVEDRKLLGIVTRWDYLQYRKGSTPGAGNEKSGII